VRIGKSAPIRKASVVAEAFLTCLLPTSWYNHSTNEMEAPMKIIYRDKEWELHGWRRVRDMIKEVGLISQTVLAVRDGKLLTGDVMLKDGDEVKLIAVVSGG
jgi:sulfur carrier protein ThiS